MCLSLVVIVFVGLKNIISLGMDVSIVIYSLLFCRIVGVLVFSMVGILVVDVDEVLYLWV